MNRREAIKTITGAGALSALSIGATQGETPVASRENPASKAIEQNEMKFWLETSLKRVYPTSPAGSSQLAPLLTARAAKLSFQACFRNEKINSAIVKCEVVGADDLKPVIRRVGFVPMRNINTYVPTEEVEGIGFIPGLCPDPLFPESTAHVGPHANGVFWISLFVPAEAKIGRREITVRMTLENEFSYVDFVRPKPWSVEMTVPLEVRPLVLKPRENFPVTNWISADSIWEHYKTEPCSERFWQLADGYIANLVTHGHDVIYTPMFNNRHEILVRPAQLLRVKRTAPDQYEFDFTDVRRWVRIALRHGANHIEFPHFFTPAPTSGRYPQRIFERDAKSIGAMLWAPEISATGDTYKSFLKQFIPQFKQFMEEEKILEKSFFHCADEPDGDVQMADYRKARALLKELAPWMQVMDAMSEPRFATERLSDMPIPSIVTAGIRQSELPGVGLFLLRPAP
ncbi:MAG: hypothetical protein H0X66_04915 [Verrucomicrobia bacterium]|nr:hypothetical protein [Verrucomicrobiota bacterium]